MVIGVGLTLIFLLSLVGFFDKGDAVRKVAQLTDEQKRDRGLLPPLEEEQKAKEAAVKVNTEATDPKDKTRSAETIHPQRTQNWFRSRIENRQI